MKYTLFKGSEEEGIEELGDAEVDFGRFAYNNNSSNHAMARNPTSPNHIFYTSGYHSGKEIGPYRGILQLALANLIEAGKLTKEEATELVSDIIADRAWFKFDLVNSTRESLVFARVKADANLILKEDSVRVVIYDNNDKEYLVEAEDFKGIKVRINKTPAATYKFVKSKSEGQFVL